MKLTFSATITDADLAGLAARYVSEDRSSVKNVTVKITPDGVVFGGVYDALIDIGFTTRWTVSVAGPELTLKLADVQVASVPMPGPVIRGRILKGIGEATRGVPGVRLAGEELVIHIGDALAAIGVRADVVLTAVRLYVGEAIVEAM